MNTGSFARLVVTCLLLFVTAAASGAEPPDNITLVDSEQIAAAQRIDDALNGVSARVMACVERQQGETAGCTCESREVCPFKPAFDTFIVAFCEAVDRYPAWKSQNVFYQSGDTGVGHTLGTRAMQLHYGAACE